MKAVNFKFELDQEVVTRFDTSGFVTMQGVDSSGVIYYVKTAEDAGAWHKEEHLSFLQ